MGTLEKVRLPNPAGRDRIIEQLDGCGVLANFICNIVRRMNFDVYAFLPPDLSEERVLSFDSGGLFGTEAQSFLSVSDKILHKEILSHLEEHGSNFIITVNPLARPGDPCLEKIQTRTYTVGDSVIHYLAESDSSSVENFLRDSSSSVPSAMFFLDNDPGCKSWDRIDTIGTLKRVMPHIGLKKIIVRGEYDGESFLMADVTTSISGISKLED